MLDARVRMNPNINRVYNELSMIERITWQQRFSNYRRALSKLNKAAQIINGIKVLDHGATGSDEMEVLKDGLIQRFEYTHELAWNVMKDYAEYQGAASIRGCRDAMREAFKMELITHPEGWTDMLGSRNLTSHTYNCEIAEEIFDKIIESYSFLFRAFEEKMESIRSGTQKDIFDKDLD